VNLGDGYKDLALDLLLGDSLPATPGTLYLALYTVAPTSAGGGTEVSSSGTAYARVATPNTTTYFGPASGGTDSNNLAVTFPTATLNWGTVAAFAWHTSPSLDQIYLWGDTAAPVAVNTGETAQFAGGALTVTAA
jgi:hypothetical protein